MEILTSSAAKNIKFKFVKCDESSKKYSFLYFNKKYSSFFLTNGYFIKLWNVELSNKEKELNFEYLTFSLDLLDIITKNYNKPFFNIEIKEVDNNFVIIVKYENNISSFNNDINNKAPKIDAIFKRHYDNKKIVAFNVATLKAALNDLNNDDDIVLSINEYTFNQELNKNVFYYSRYEPIKGMLMTAKIKTFEEKFLDTITANLEHNQKSV